MRDIAQRLGRRRRRAGTLIAAAATVTVVAALGAPSALAVGTVTVKTSFENSPVSLNTSDAIGYAITNSTGSPETVSFTDTLPSGVALDSPISLANTAGTSPNVCSNVTVTNPGNGQGSSPGDNAVTVSATVSSGSGTICTISLAVVASTPSVGDAAWKDSYSGATYTLAAGGGPTVTAATTPGSLVVLSNPAITLTVPATNQSFTLGQVANATFGCTQTDPLDSISAFFGTDDEGNQIQPGQPIDTLDPGTRTLTVDCYSNAGGGDVEQVVTYKVGSYSLTALKESKKTGYVSFRTLVPAGKLVAKLLYGVKKTVIATATSNVASRGTVSVTLKPTAAGRRLLAAVKGRTAAATVQASFTPKAIGSGDSQIIAAGATVLTKNVKLPLAHTAKAARS